jgi:hypothetical protein
MFKKTLVLILVFLLGILFFVYFKSKTVEKIEINNYREIENIEKAQDDKQNEDNNREHSTIEQDQFKNLSLEDLLNLGQALECSWSVEKAEISQDADAENVDEEASGGTEKGRIFFQGGDFFQEVEITENSVKTVIKSLKQGNWFYQWNSLVTNQGMKMSFERAKNSEFLKMNKIYDWNCQEFSGSEDIFQIPEEIKFLNF